MDDRDNNNQELEAPQICNIDGDADREDDGEVTVFEQPSTLVNELEDEEAELNDSEDGDFDFSLLEELLPRWREVNEAAITEVMMDHAEMVEIALMRTMKHLHSLCSEEETSEVDWKYEAATLELYAESYLKGYEDASREFMPQFIEAIAMAEHMVESHDQLEQAAHDMEEEANSVLQEMLEEVDSIMGIILEENESLQTRVNILEVEQIVQEECRGLTLTQQSEIRSILNEAEIPTNDTFNLSDYRSKVKKLKLKYSRTPKTGLHDASYNPKAPRQIR